MQRARGAREPGGDVSPGYGMQRAREPGNGRGCFDLARDAARQESREPGGDVSTWYSMQHADGARERAGMFLRLLYKAENSDNYIHPPIYRGILDIKTICFWHSLKTILPMLFSMCHDILILAYRNHIFQKDFEKMILQMFGSSCTWFLNQAFEK